MGVSFFGTAFSEPTLIKLASGFEAVTQVRKHNLPTFAENRPITLRLTSTGSYRRGYSRSRRAPANNRRANGGRTTCDYSRPSPSQTAKPDAKAKSDRGVSASSVIADLGAHFTTQKRLCFWRRFCWPRLLTDDWRCAWCGRSGVIPCSVGG